MRMMWWLLDWAVWSIQYGNWEEIDHMNIVDVEGE